MLAEAFHNAILVDDTVDSPSKVYPALVHALLYQTMYQTPHYLFNIYRSSDDINITVKYVCHQCFAIMSYHWKSHISLQLLYLYVKL